MLYIFAGFPGKEAPAGSLQLHAGGLQYCIETVEELALLEHDPAVQYRKEGVFANETDEMLYPVEYRMSDICIRDGITWEWFPEHWSFGNGVTVHNTSANLEYRTVIHGTDLTLEEFKKQNRGKSYRPTDLILIDEPWRHEGWEKYEERWLPGTCPQENHVVHLTWLVTAHKLPEFAYQRIRELAEDGAKPKDRHRYNTEPGNHFSEIRPWNGKPAFGGNSCFTDALER